MSLGDPRAAGGAATFAGGSHFFSSEGTWLSSCPSWEVHVAPKGTTAHNAASQRSWDREASRVMARKRQGLIPHTTPDLGRGCAALSSSAPWLGVRGEHEFHPEPKAWRSNISVLRGGPWPRGSPGDTWGSTCFARVCWVFMSAEGSRRHFWKAYKISAIYRVGAAVTCRPLLGGGELGGPGSGASDKARLPPARRPLTWGPSPDKPTSPPSAATSQLGSHPLELTSYFKPH